MNLIASIFSTPLALGSTVVTPILLFIVCLLVRVQPMVALKTSFSTGFCMAGMSVLISRFGQMLADLATAMIEQQGLTAPVVDAGRRTALTIASASEIGIYIMPLAIVINIVMLLTRCTRTVNLDIWSFWLFAFVGAMVQNFTGNLAYGLVAASLSVVFTLVLADSSVKGIEKCCAMRGVSLTNAVTASFAPIAGGICWLVDRIPLQGKKDISFGWLQKRIGYFGDPVLIGTLAVAVFGIINGMEWPTALQTAVQVGAYIFILPKIMLLLGDSLRPLSEGLERTSREQLKLHGNLTVGLSSAVGLGNPTAMLLSVVLVPFSIWIATIVGGNQFGPSADFSMLPYMIIMVVAICRGGILRSTLSCVLSVLVMLFSASAVSGLFTQAAVAADPATYGAAGTISSMYAAGNPLMLVIAWVASFGIAGVGLMVLMMLALSIWNYNRLTGNVKIYVRKQKALRTFAIDNLRVEAEKRRELRRNAVSKKREELRRAVETDRLIREEGMTVAPVEVEQLSIFNPESLQPSAEAPAATPAEEMEQDTPPTQQDSV